MTRSGYDTLNSYESLLIKSICWFGTIALCDNAKLLRLSSFLFCADKKVNPPNKNNKVMIIFTLRVRSTIGGVISKLKCFGRCEGHDRSEPERDVCFIVTLETITIYLIPFVFCLAVGNLNP